MNKNDRKQLAKALDLLEEAKSIIENIKDEEATKFDNLSEGLQASEKGQKFEADADTLDAAVTSIDEAIDGIQGIE